MATDTVSVLLEGIRDGAQSVRKAALGKAREFIASNPEARSEFAARLRDESDGAKGTLLQLLSPIQADQRELIAATVEIAMDQALSSATRLGAIGALGPLKEELAVTEMALTLVRQGDTDLVPSALSLVSDRLGEGTVADAYETLREHSNPLNRTTYYRFLPVGLEVPRSDVPTPEIETRPSARREGFVIEDEEARLTVLQAVNDAREQVADLLEFCGDDNRPTVAKIIDADIFPALERVRILLERNYDEAEVVTRRRDAELTLREVGALIRGVASGIGGVSTKVYAVIRLGELIAGGSSHIHLT